MIKSVLNVNELSTTKVFQDNCEVWINTVKCLTTPFFKFSSLLDYLKTPFNMKH